MPLDPDIPFRALAGMQRVQPYDPLEVQGQIDRNRVYQAKAQQAQQEMQSQQRMQQLSQQYGDDYDGLISAIAKEGYADKAVALSEGVWKSRGEAAKADQEQSKSSVQHLELGTRILQMARENPDLYPAARDWITKQAPQLSPMLPPNYDEPTVDGVLQLGRDTQKYFDARDKAAELLIQKDTRGSVLTAFAGASNQAQWDSLTDGYKKLGLAPILSLVGPTWSPEAQSKAAKDSITPEKQAELGLKAADDTRQAAAQAETARHNRVEEGLGGARVGLERQRLAQDAAGTAAVQADVTQGARVTLSGKKYIDLGDYEGQKERSAARVAASKAGLPVVDPKTGASLRAIDNAKQNAMEMWRQIGSKLPKDAAGRLLGGPGNKLSKFFQTEPELAAFGSFRVGAIQQIQALAEPGMGLRINQAEIKAAMENDIPQITDDVPTAAQRIKNFVKMLDNKENDALTRDRSSLQGGAGAGPKEGETKPIPGHPGTEQTFRNGQWIRTK